MTKQIFKKNGFSLVEIAIVCGVLLILLIPVFTMLSQGNTSTVHSRNEILANQYAANIISYSKLINYESTFFQHYGNNDGVLDENLILNNNNGLETPINLDDLGESFVAFKNLNPTTYIRVQDYNYDFTSNWSYRYKVITVKVEWNEPGEPDKQIVEKTGLITER